MKEWLVRVAILTLLAAGTAVLCMVADVCPPESFAQEGTEIPAEKAVKSDEPGIKRDAPARELKAEDRDATDREATAARRAVKAAPARIENPAQRAAKDSPTEKNAKQAAEPRLADEGLLEIGEGAFKYRRIPHIKIAETAVQPPDTRPGEGEEKKKAERDKEASGEKGLFGLSKGATDVLAKVFLFGIIIVVFLLYRYRTRGRRSSVLKRFPKA